MGDKCSVLELKINVRKEQYHRLDVKFEDARAVYNAVLNEALSNYEQITRTKEYRADQAVVKKYYEERGTSKRNCEIDRIVQGCVGVRRTTGQHPGGIIVLPLGENIYSFTPVQHLSLIHI